MSNDCKDLLIELGTEELPPKALKKLSNAFTTGIVDGLKKAGFEINDVESFAAPRRLAVLIKNIAAAQPDRDVERKGPALKAAYDADGNATKAVMGFAKSCGVEVADLQQQETDKGVWLIFKATEKGKVLSVLIEDIINQSLAKLPIPKRMRWGNNNAEFVRPAHWLVLMFGEEVIDAEVLGLKSSAQTFGHRFHAPAAITLKTASDYSEKLLSQGFVIADFKQRKEKIKQQVIAAVQSLTIQLPKGEAIIDEELLDEVTALNEWPIAVAGEFDEVYLDVPDEALIKTMQDNQKYFPVKDSSGNLRNYFITISNIDSKSPEKVKQGNERVVHPRLADAKFFWEQDQKQPLESFNAALEKVVFQKKLGSLAEKTQRVTKLASFIAEQLNANIEYVRRAALLSKSDLMTDMVGEFASLQGIMGKRYAQKAGEADEVAEALDEQYKPRGASDDTASTVTGQILSISDKLDTLVGIFAIGQKPTGEKDPYALRRASLGILRTIIERQLDLDLKQLIAESAKLLKDKVDATKVEADVFEYIIERLRAYYLDRNITADVFDAVSALSPSQPLDFDKRIKAVSAFCELAEAQSLAAANKRVGNILKKSAVNKTVTVDKRLLSEDAEKKLFETLNTLSQTVEPMFDAGDYEAALSKLSSLRDPVDAFFDSVMVMADDEAIKNNRIALLNTMNQLFLRAADLSRLH
ncbi:Glycyl-tRNA synthetase beta chain [hydrothermal vent metagenome]|uniref:glycine--tRNA ligase n=1 Tax=hydrothermal vent metagenome TaxID=652676 RepID=A0A3B0WBT5_9ZZZZ